MANIGSGRILSIQSHVAFGYVGGKAAVFPLQCLGYDVDVVNTVNFSNHSGYGRLGGTKANAAELSGIFKSMQENGLLKPKRLLTGYIPGAEALSAVEVLARRLRKDSPDMIYLLDPVLGDSGQLYVAPDVIPVYLSMLPLATVITPNWFEVEVLTKTKLTSLTSLRRALEILHVEYHVPHVVVSSIPLSSWLIEALPSSIQETSSDSESLLCISSENLREDDGISTVHASCVPLIPGYFSGVGDLFSALLVAHFEPTQTLPTAGNVSQTPLSYAATQALSKTHAILKLTHNHAIALPEDERLPTDDEKDVAEPARKIKRMRGRELRLVQGQDIIRGIKAYEVRQMYPWADFWKA